MNYRIDNLQYCNWSRKIFEINREAQLDAVHVTLAYHEDYDELLLQIKKWDDLFKENKYLFNCHRVPILSNVLSLVSSSNL